MTKVIGITGGIGSGKTTITRLFSEKGVPVYIADEEAKRLMQSTEIITAIKKEFGTAIFDNDFLNKKKLAAIVFKDKEKLATLNNIVHPAVKKDFSAWVNKNEEKPYVIYESAILFESNNYLECDFIITVVAPQEIRINRVMNRDHSSRENVIDRMKMQWSDEQRAKKSDFIITNLHLDDTKHEVAQILKILNITQNHP